MCTFKQYPEHFSFLWSLNEPTLIELEGNCDFSSNNNVWTMFFLTTILNIVGLLLLWEIDWNFRFLDSDFFVGLMLYHCLRRWPNIKTTLRRRFVFDAITTVSSMLKCSIWKVILFISNTQCWFNAEQPSATLAPHWNIIGYRPLYFNWLNVQGAERVQVGRVASDNGPLYWMAKIHSWAFPDMYIIVLTWIHILIQKTLNKSRRT